MTDPTATLAHALEAAAITGSVVTPREVNLRHIEKFLAGERQFDFGVTLTQEWDYDSVFNLMVTQCGINPDPTFTTGVDTISTVRCIAELDRVRAAIRDVAENRGTLLFASGHPSGLLPVYIKFREWALSLGGTTEAQRDKLPVEGGGDVRTVGGVWVWHKHGGLPHTHLPEFAEVVHTNLVTSPDLVVADHGWAGYFGSRGFRTVGFADCNDPALFVAQAQGQLEACVPLDDNVPPHLYGPLIDYVTRLDS